MKALFLDRDGIINHDGKGYIYKIKDFIFIDDIFQFVSLFVSHGYQVFVITNQSGIGRGYYSQEDFEHLSQWMKKVFLEHNITIEEVYYCPHTPIDNCLCRKPLTGMIDQALKEYSINLKKSFMVGDKQSDSDLAINAKINHSIAITSQTINHASYSFATITQALEYFKSHKGLL